MAVYKSSISSRANGAAPPASASTSAYAPSQKNEKVKPKKHPTHSHSRKSPRNSAADSLSKFTVNQTFTPEYRRQLCLKTLDLAATRTSLNKKLDRASKTDKASKNKLKHDKLLDRHRRLEKREKRHLATRTRALVELERNFKLNPTAEQAKDLRLIKKLLLTFKRNLKANMGVRKNKCPRPSTGKGDSSSIIGDTDDSFHQDDSVIHDTSIATAPERSDSGEKPNGTKRKRDASRQRSTVSLTALFSQEDPEKAGNHAEEVVQEAVHATKKIKKDKLDVAEPRNSSPLAPSSTKLLVNGDKNDTVSCSGALPVDKPASPKGDKKGKKHSLPVDGEVKPKSKKVKVEQATAITPATTASPKTNLDLPKPRHYHEQAVYDMLTDPLGFDDFVHDDTRPKNKRPKFRRFGFRYSKPDPSFTGMMSGGIGPPVSTKAVAKSRPADRLSNSVLKRSHNKKVSETVHDMKSKKKSGLDTLTEKPKYSINKESWYPKTNGAGKLGTNGNTHQRKNKEQGRQQHLRSQYSTFTCPDVPDLIPTMTSAVSSDDVDEASNSPDQTMTSAISADEDSDYDESAMTTTLFANDVDEGYSYPDPTMTSDTFANDVNDDSKYPEPTMTSSNLILVKPASDVPRTPRRSKVNVFPQPDRAWYKQPRQSGPPRMQMFSSIPAPNSNYDEEQLSHNDHDNDFSSHDTTAGQDQLTGNSGNESSSNHSATGGIEADNSTDGLSLPLLYTPEFSSPDDDGFFDISPYLSMLQSHGKDADAGLVQGNETGMSNIDTAFFDSELVRVIKPTAVYGDDISVTDTGGDDHDNTLLSVQSDAAG